jgi:adenylosuccinate lyase
MATENILMYCVKKGGDRQELHERIRKHSVEAAKGIKQEGSDNDLIKRILNDKTFNISEQEMKDILNAENFCGRAKEQTEEFLSEVKPVLDSNRDLLGVQVNIKV